MASAEKDEPVVRGTLVRHAAMSLESFSRATGLHPELVSRFVRLGLLDATTDAGGALYFAFREVGRAARIQRLRAVLPLNYAALALVLDLLDRIDVLEAANRSRPQGGSDRRWT
jgi:hypothetical protein